jgi:hypothetical protein
LAADKPGSSLSVAAPFLFVGLPVYEAALFPFDAPKYGGDWRPLDGLSLVDAIDRLYREAVDRIIETQVQNVTNRANTSELGRGLKVRLGEMWWGAYGPAAGMTTRGRADVPDLPQGPYYARHWSERQLILHTVVAQLLAELRLGGIVVQADGDHTIEFQRVVVSVGFWRAANWVLYRWSPHDHALPQLVALGEH